MGLVKEFKEFAMRGNVVDLAVAVVIGGAFGKIVTSLVSNIIMPPLTLITAKYGVSFNEMSWKVATAGPKLNPDGTPVRGPDGTIEIIMQQYPILKYGPFLQSIVDFLLIAFAIFVVVKFLNTARARFEQKKEEVLRQPPEDIQLLREIRDALRAR